MIDTGCAELAGLVTQGSLPHRLSNKRVVELSSWLRRLARLGLKMHCSRRVPNREYIMRGVLRDHVEDAVKRIEPTTDFKNSKPRRR